MTWIRSSALLLLFAACQASSPAPLPAETSPAWNAPSSDGPVLCGTVRHPDGRPLAGVQVTPHAGFATRFPGPAVRTDAQGHYRIAPVTGSLIGGEDGVADFYVGVCVGSADGVNPPEVLPWEDVRVPQAAGTVVVLDFVFEPHAVPEGAPGT